MDKTTNREARAHLLFLQVEASEHERSLVYRSMEEAGVAPLDPARKQALARLIDERYGVDHQQEISEHGDDIRYWLHQTELNLHEDLLGYAGPAQAGVLDHIALGFMPHIASNAFSEAVPHAPQEHVIGVNFGLFWVGCILAEALLRVAEGDEPAGLAAYRVAERVYLAQNQRQLHAAWNDGRSMDDNYSVQGGAVGSVVLRFVGLHELGHVVLGHVGAWRMCFVPEEGRVEYGMSETLGIAAKHAMELEADAYALARMVERTGGKEAMWNNLLFIGAFFRLLAHLESTGAITPCEHHPPPLVRLGRLYELTAAELGPPPNDAWLWAEQRQNEWAGSL